MKLITYDRGNGPEIGAIVNDGVINLCDAFQSHAKVDASQAQELVPNDMTQFLMRASGDLAAFEEAVANASSPSTRLSDVHLLAPVPHPGKIIGVGRNYGEHAGEGGLEAQEKPRLFVKVSSSVIGPDKPIIRPKGITKLDWEVELAVVIGRTMKDVPEDQALSHVAGFTLLNDVSARELQFDVSPPQTTFAKSMDSFTPMGPFLCTIASFPDATDVELTLHINGELMQRGRTSDMIFSTNHILSYISRFVTLLPGDVVATGTPSGVGHFRDPPVYLKDGDLVRLEIPGLGVLENPVMDAR